MEKRGDGERRRRAGRLGQTARRLRNSAIGGSQQQEHRRSPRFADANADGWQSQVRYQERQMVQSVTERLRSFQLTILGFADSALKSSNALNAGHFNRF